MPVLSDKQGITSKTGDTTIPLELLDKIAPDFPQSLRLGMRNHQQRESSDKGVSRALTCCKFF